MYIFNLTIKLPDKIHANQHNCWDGLIENAGNTMNTRYIIYRKYVAFGIHIQHFPSDTAQLLFCLKRFLILSKWIATLLRMAISDQLPMKQPMRMPFLLIVIKGNQNEAE